MCVWLIVHAVFRLVSFLLFVLSSFFVFFVFLLCMHARGVWARVWAMGVDISIYHITTTHILCLFTF